MSSMAVAGYDITRQETRGQHGRKSGAKLFCRKSGNTSIRGVKPTDHGLVTPALAACLAAVGTIKQKSPAKFTVAVDGAGDFVQSFRGSGQGADIIASSTLLRGLPCMTCGNVAR